MHNLSMAAGVALARIAVVSDDSIEEGSAEHELLENDMADFAEEARVCLMLDGVRCNKHC